MKTRKTEFWVVDKRGDSPTSYPQIEEASLWIKGNEVVAFPTETVYGLGANALSDEAVNKIYEAKGRPSDNPLIVHIANEDQLSLLVNEIPRNAQMLMEHFWPGALTIIMEKREDVPEKVTGGLQTVAVRMPDHPVALALIETSGLPLAAPSANRSGRPSPTSAKHVLQDLDGRIAGILDGGTTGLGLESTVIDCSEEMPVILRPGGVTKQEIEGVIGPVLLDPALQNEKEAPKSPGMKYTHYAPDAPLVIVDGSREFLQNQINYAKNEKKKVGVIATEESHHFYDADVVLVCGSRNDLNTVASKLYDTLRSFNDYDVDQIFSESFSNEGVGEAIMNRLIKAAGHTFIRES